MNCFIFGGTGFIGTHLTKLLARKYPEANIYNFDIIEPGTPLPTVKHYNTPLTEGETLDSTFIKCDVREPIVVDVPATADDIIFNFAAVHRTPGHKDFEYFETNIKGAENVTAFAEKYGIRKIVFTSSIAPYGAAEELKKETTLPTPNTAYGISKLVAEKIHQIWQAKDKENRQLTILRPGVVFGKGENGNFTRLYWGIRGHQFAYPGRKDTIKACIYVKDLVRLMLHCIEKDSKETILFNCCYEPAYTIEQIVGAMKATTGMKTWVPNIPNWLIIPAAYLIGALGAPMGICPARVKKLQISTNICGKKLSKSGFPFKYTFEEALADWYNDNNRLGLK